MKNVYMWQPNYLYGNDAYLPYSIGALAAYAWEDRLIDESYKLKKMGYLRNPIEEEVSSLEVPFICIFSNYTWNFEYNKKLAKTIKYKYPDCFIIFGGHQISVNNLVITEADRNQLMGIKTIDSEVNFVDIFIFDEGEIAFHDILKALSQNISLKEIPNIAYKKDFAKEENKYFFTERKMEERTDLPSPYLNGFFNEMIEKNPYSFSATLETNRGCPFSCAYCDWGIYKSKIRKFPMERIKAEIDWFAEHQIELVFGADSNFGIFERDEEIINYLIYSRKTKGFPKKFRVAYTKNTGERVFEMNRRLNNENMCKGATLSFQSLSEIVLKNIGRKNIPLDYFMELMKKYNESSIPTYSEIIMGLPGETYESFCDGVGELLKSGQHSSINIYLCELLPNSLMAQPDYIKQYKIETLKTLLNQYHCVPDEGDIQEYSTIVIGNLSLSKQDWKKCYILAWTIQCFHCLGLLRYYAIYLYYEKGVDYKTFYKGFLSYIEKRLDTVVGQAYLKVNTIIDNALENGSKAAFVYTDDRFGKVLWPTEEGSYLEILTEYTTFLQEIEPFLKKFDIEPDIYKELLLYQRYIICKPNDKYFELSMHYDFYKYFKNILIGDYKCLQRKNCKMKIKPEKVYSDWKTFAKEVVWYGRKGGRYQYNNVNIEEY